MITRFAIGFVAAATLSGCLPPNVTNTSPRPLKPMDGPKASIHVDYYGGAFTRQIQTRFRVENNAYVVVGHLGGDGEIRILYPETPSRSGLVYRGKTVSLKPFTAMYDMSPHLFSFASMSYRSVSTQYESYDGLGHGYVFIIASRFPIDHRALASGKGYESVTVNDYDTASDLRYAVRQFADEIVTGPYTLQYARNQNRSLYAQLTGCPTSWGLMSYGGTTLSMMDFSFAFFPYPGSSLMSGFAFSRYGMGRMCRGTYYAAMEPRYYSTSTVYVPPTSTPAAPVTPQLQRPTRRTFQDEARKPLLSGHSGLDRGVTRTTRTVTREGTAWRPSASRPTYSGYNDFHDRGRWSGSSGSSEMYRPSRPIDTPRIHEPPPTTTTTTTTSSGEGTKADRPNPRP